MSTSEELHDAVGPSIAMSKEDRRLAEDLVDVIEGLDLLDEEEVRERYFEETGEFVYGEDARSLEDYKEQFKPAKLGLPSFGEKRDDCGVGIPHVCEGCGHTMEVGRTCAQSRCPRCWAAWVLKRAPGIVARIMSAAKMKDGAQYKHHAVISPPEDTYIDAENPEQAALEAVGEFMDRIDMDGLSVYHPWSGDHDDENGEKSFTESHVDDRGKWAPRLQEERGWFGDVREELKHRPHFHLIGTTSWFPGGDVTEHIYEETGWVIHRITERNGSPISLGDVQSVARAVCYSLSHTAIDTREDGFGGSHNAYVRKKKGSAYHTPSDSDPHPSHAENLRKAKEAVYNVAPDVLGISSSRFECQTQVAEEDVDKDHDISELIDDPADASAADADGLEESSATKMMKCRGDLVDVDDADFVEDENWQRQVPNAEDAVAAREAWKEAGGWQGWLDQGEWSGQATLEGKPTGDVSLEDDPPPD